MVDEILRSINAFRKSSFVLLQFLDLLFHLLYLVRRYTHFLPVPLLRGLRLQGGYLGSFISDGCFRRRRFPIFRRSSFSFFLRKERHIANASEILVFGAPCACSNEKLKIPEMRSWCYICYFRETKRSLVRSLLTGFRRCAGKAANTVGMLPAHSRVVCPVLSKQSASKCSEHKTSFFFGVQPSRLTARSHALRNRTSLGNLKHRNMFHSVSSVPGLESEIFVQANAFVIANIYEGKRAKHAYTYIWKVMPGVCSRDSCSQMPPKSPPLSREVITAVSQSRLVRLKAPHATSLAEKERKSHTRHNAPVRLLPWAVWRCVGVSSGASPPLQKF